LARPAAARTASGYNDLMARPGFDAAVVGAGPAGSVAALVLARGGAKVALVDKAGFPRDKACGDMLGPRGVQLLEDLDLTRDATPHLGVGDMVVLGPTGGKALLRARAGSTYPGQGWAAPRRAFDDWLRQAALDAGAEPVRARARGVAPGGVALDDDRVLPADMVIGADGANSAIAASAGLVNPTRVMWGFAVRAYLVTPVEIPVISFWDPTPGRGFPGYGWIFPLADGRANAGLGVGAGTDRRRGAGATRQLDAFLAYLSSVGLLDRVPGRLERLGGWLKMGMVGTTPASGNVLLVGDAAGLVNPLQGEGIADAMASARAAAGAVLAGPGSAAITYSAHLRRRYLSYHAANASLHRCVLDRPRLVSVLGRALTAPGVGRTIGGAWALYWNDLLDGAAPGIDSRLGGLASLAIRGATSRGASRRWLSEALRSPGQV
jgi:geranylgeranyl reductase family protein